MNTEQLTGLIDRLEDYSKRHAAAYRLRVAALAALGYGYLLAIVLALLILIYVVLADVAFNFITVKFAWILLLLAGLVLRAMWVTLPEPDGRELQSENAPQLFALIKEVSIALQGPKVHRVFISDEFNASIVQIPQLGMFGWLRNYLVVGLPLLNALTPEEFRSVLAHEFGHLSGNHGRFSGWIYRLRQTWIQIQTTIHQEKHYASFLFEWFLKWYAPFFNAYSFVLARAQEYEADSYSVDLAGRSVAAQTLVRMDTKERALAEKFWPSFFTGANEEAQPPKDPFVRMLGGVGLAVDRGNAETWFLQSLKIKTGYDDTHPSLSDRLIGMGYQRAALTSPAVIAELVPADRTDERSAAEFYLQDLPEGMLLSFERLLRERIVPSWRERHKFVQEARTRLSKLEEKTRNEPLTEEELWERAHLLGETMNRAAALPAIREILRNNPGNAGANFSLGEILLEEDDESGIQFLETSIELDASATAGACELIYYFHRRHGREQEASVYRTRAEQHSEKLEQHYRTAFKLSADDNFEPHGLDAKELAEIQRDLRGSKRLRQAFLVRKVFADGSEPLFVLGVVSNYAWHDFHTKNDSQALVSQIANDLQFSRQIMFVMLEDKHKSLRKVFSAIPDAEVFPSS